jgi:hypothetical protein
LEPKEIRAHLRGVADVVDIAEMDRKVRPIGFDERRDLSRLVGAGSPIAGERDADLVAIAPQPVDAVVSVFAVVSLEGMSLADSKSPIFGHPFPKSPRGEGGEGWIRQMLSGFGARTRPTRLRMLPLIGEQGRARQAAEILKVSAHAVRLSLAGRSRRRRLVSARAHAARPA